MRNALQRKLRAKRFKNSKTKFLPALGIFNKQRNSKPVFKSGAARRASQSRRLCRRREEDEEEDDDEEESSEDEGEEDDDDKEEDDDEECESEDEPTPAITSRRRKRRSSNNKQSKKATKKLRTSADTLCEVSYNKFNSKKGAAKIPGRRTKLDKCGKSKTKALNSKGGGSRLEIGGLQIRANRDSLKIERHNNLAYFNRIQDELRDLVQQRDAETESSPVPDENATPNEDYDDGELSVMEYEDEVEDENGECFENDHRGAGDDRHRRRGRNPQQRMASRSGLHPRTSAPLRARSPSTDSVYSHRSAASSLVEPPLSRSHATRSSFARGDAYCSRSLTPRSEFHFDAAASEPPRSCRSTPVSSLASPHSPTPPTPFIDPAATALGLHDSDPETTQFSHAQSRSRVNHAPVGGLMFDSFSTPRDLNRHAPRRTAGMDFSGLLDETPRRGSRQERYSDALELELNNDDFFSLPSLSQTPAGSGRATSRSRSHRPDFDVPTPTPPLFQRSRARMHSSHQHERASSRDHMFDGDVEEQQADARTPFSPFSFAAGSPEFRLRARRGF